MKFGSIKFKVIFTIILSLLVCAVSILYLLDMSYKNNIRVTAEQSIKSSEQAFKNLEKNDTNMLSATLQSLLVNPEIKQAFIQKDREKLYNLVSPLFKELRERYRITHWYFELPESEGKVFLRVHKPQEFGDTLKRVTYLDSIKTKDFAAGKEVGKTAAFALRVVHPYYDGNKLIGYLELGEEIDHFLKIMKEQTGSDFGIVMEKKFVDQKNWASIREKKGLKDNYNDLNDVVLVDNTTQDESIISFQGKISDVPDNGMILDETKKGDSYFVRGIFPLYDAAHKKVGGVFVLKDITGIYTEMQAMKNRVIMFIIVLVVAISAVLIYMINHLIIKRLNSMIDTVTRVVGGDYNTQIHPSANDEIGKFESLFEQFRNIFVSVANELAVAQESEITATKE